MAELIISSDSHVIEPNDLWTERLPARFKDQAPKYMKRTVFEKHDGGKDPARRVHEMAKDGVSAEVLYASLALNQFALTDADLQEACFRVYNDWLIEYCSHAPDRLYGLALISCYNIDNAIAETIRCKKAGMRGVTVWQVPADEFSFTTDHYDRLWAVCQELDLPVSLHILTGMPYGPSRKVDYNLVPNLSNAVNRKLLYTSDSLLHIIGSGTLDRFPALKIVVVEAEISWLPYCLGQWDRYLMKSGRHKGTLKLSASEYFERQIYGTFFNDPPAGILFKGWGTDNCMWSNDFPHGNSTWPNSRVVIERDLGGLSSDVRAKILSGNVIKLYDLPALEPVASIAA